MRKIIEWLRESNRWKHLMGGCLIGLVSSDVWCATVAGGGIASALEYKDKAWGGLWDWIDWGLTVAGVMIGFLIRWSWK